MIVCFVNMIIIVHIKKDYIRTQSNLRDFIDTQKCNTPCDITMMCNAYEINTVTSHDKIME